MSVSRQTRSIASLGHVAVVRLNRLEDRNHGILAAAEPRDALIDEGEIEFRHYYCYCEAASGYFADAEQMCSFPRR